MTVDPWQLIQLILSGVMAAGWGLALRHAGRIEIKLDALAVTDRALGERLARIEGRLGLEPQTGQG